uniref:phage major capsid protein n=1 Tax=Gordonia sp. B7-2 TaxID=3420932 RepID=UPI003D8AA2CB
MAPDQWVPELSGAYVDEALSAESIAYRVATLVPIDATKIRIPTYGGDPTSQWVEEGEDLDVTDATLDGIDVEPKTIAVLSKISRQFFDDQGQLSTAVLAGQGRDLGRKIDAALFGTNVGNDKAPAGLRNVSGVNVISAGGTWADLDAFAEAKFHAETLGEVVNFYAAHPDDALELATLKDESGSIRPVLGPDPSQPTATSIGGVPVVVSEYVNPGDVWAIPTRHLHLVQRGQVAAEISHDAYFGSLSVALRSFARVAFGYSRPAAFSRVTTNSGS